MRKGRLSDDEKRFINRTAPSMTVEDIAKKLDRSVSAIDKYLKEELQIGLSASEAAGYQLEQRPYFTELKQQFTDDELQLFKYHWGRIISQFKDDVFPTEELQVVDVIKLEIDSLRRLQTSIIILFSSISAVSGGLSIGLIIPILGGSTRPIFQDTPFDFLDN